MRTTFTRRAALALATAALTALALPMPSAVATTLSAGTTTVAVPSAAATDPAVAADFSSIFADQDAELDGSGWAQCPTPVTWTADLGGLDTTAGQRALEDLQWSFDQWSAASGLTFQFAGTTAFVYDDASFTLTPADGSTLALRTVAIAFVDDAATARLGGQTVGLGSPSQVIPTTKEIVAGTAVFRTDHAQVADQAATRSLYLHELGHVLGLAHAANTANVMYPIVRELDTLGAGDVNGVQAFDKPCTSAA